MGHIRLGRLPRTKRWSEVVELIGDGLRRRLFEGEQQHVELAGHRDEQQAVSECRTRLQEIGDVSLARAPEVHDEHAVGRQFAPGAPMEVGARQRQRHSLRVESIYQQHVDRLVELLDEPRPVIVHDAKPLIVFRNAELVAQRDDFCVDLHDRDA